MAAQSASGYCQIAGASTRHAYEIYAIKYATRAAKRSNHFIGGDPHEGPMPVDYYLWVVRNQERLFVVYNDGDD